MINSYQIGNTVRFSCTFLDFNGEKIDPSVVKMIIYNSIYEIMLEEVVTVANKQGIGEYFYDYITVGKNYTLYYEWYGEINGKPSLKRGTITTNFI